MPLERTTVFVADDHPVFRDGLVRALRSRPEFEVAGEAGDGREALEAIKRLEPAVALLDLKMPGLDGAAIAHAVRRDGLPTRVVLISAHAPSELVYRAISLGAAAYLSKDASREEICDTVAAVARGETRLSPEIQGELVRQIQMRAVEERPALSPREREVLELIAEGFSAPDIARRLHVSPATVKTHLQSLYEKLGVSDRAAAVASAMRTGLLE
ncbi:MAG TPA: response regulator transcription factor [Solirubrobacteraceae bacterium]|nr:response regulator transcription factor [Solirubrobacteraceae bacterium]